MNLHIVWAALENAGCSLKSSGISLLKPKFMVDSALRSLVVLVLHAAKAWGICLWLPSEVYKPEDLIVRPEMRQRYISQRQSDFGRPLENPQVFSDFASAMELCMQLREQSCNAIVCNDQQCVAPAGLDKLGVLYQPKGCARNVDNFCDRRSWYETTNPCKLDRSDQCCDNSCNTCGPPQYCSTTYNQGRQAKTCDPFLKSKVCSQQYIQDCTESPHGKAPAAIFLAPSAPRKMEPLSVVRLGFGYKVKSCARNGLAPIKDPSMCALVIGSMAPSPALKPPEVALCEDPSECADLPFGCLLRVQPGVLEGRGVMNPYGQEQWCGVGSDFEKHDCLCISVANTSVSERASPPRSISKLEEVIQGQQNISALLASERGFLPRFISRLEEVIQGQQNISTMLAAVLFETKSTLKTQQPKEQRDVSGELQAMRTELRKRLDDSQKRSENMLWSLWWRLLGIGCFLAFLLLVVQWLFGGVFSKALGRGRRPQELHDSRDIQVPLHAQPREATTAFEMMEAHGT